MKNIHGSLQVYYRSWSLIIRYRSFWSHWNNWREFPMSMAQVYKWIVEDRDLSRTEVMCTKVWCAVNKPGGHRNRCPIKGAHDLAGTAAPRRLDTVEDTRLHTGGKSTKRWAGLGSAQFTTGNYQRNKNEAGKTQGNIANIKSMIITWIRPLLMGLDMRMS